MSDNFADRYLELAEAGARKTEELVEVGRHQVELTARLEQVRCETRALQADAEALHAQLVVLRERAGAANLEDLFTPEQADQLAEFSRRFTAATETYAATVGPLIEGGQQP